MVWEPPVSWNFKDGEAEISVCVCVLVLMSEQSGDAGLAREASQTPPAWKVALKLPTLDKLLTSILHSELVTVEAKN